MRRFGIAAALLLAATLVSPRLAMAEGAFVECDGAGGVAHAHAHAHANDRGVRITCGDGTLINIRYP